jgi:hypothetical protein
MGKELNHTGPLSKETVSLGLVDRDQGREVDPVESRSNDWPPQPHVFPDLMTPLEAAMFLRLDETEYSLQNWQR